MQNRILSFSLLCSFILLTSLVGLAQGGERKIRLKNLPPAVQKTVQEQSQGAKIRGLSKEVEKGKTIYELELLVAGRSKDMLIDADGNVMEIEEEIALAAVPGAVKTELEKQMGKGRLHKLESLTKNGTLECYEVVIKTGSKTREIKVSPEGQLIK